MRLRGDGERPEKGWLATLLRQGKPFDRLRASGRRTLQAQPKRGAICRAPTGLTDLGCGLVVDVGFGFELGEHGLEEGLVGVGGAGDGQLHFLGGGDVIAGVGRKAGLRQVA